MEFSALGGSRHRDGKELLVAALGVTVGAGEGS